MSKQTEEAKERLLKALNSTVPAEDVIDAIDALIQSKIADFATILADRKRRGVGD